MSFSSEILALGLCKSIWHKRTEDIQRLWNTTVGDIGFEMACASVNFLGQLAKAGDLFKAKYVMRAHSKSVLSIGGKTVLGPCTCVTFYPTKTKINFT